MTNNIVHWIELSPKEYERVLNYDDAELYCSLLVIDGKDDWKLPTVQELAANLNILRPKSGQFFWTCSKEIYGDPVAMFYNGMDRSFSKNFIILVRPVRYASEYRKITKKI